jgi:hypothetical protein
MNTRPFVYNLSGVVFLSASHVTLSTAGWLVLVSFAKTSSESLGRPPASDVRKA